MRALFVAAVLAVPPIPAVVSSAAGSSAVMEADTEVVRRLERDKAVIQARMKGVSEACRELRLLQEERADPEDEAAFPPERVAAGQLCRVSVEDASRMTNDWQDLHNRHVRRKSLLMAEGAAPAKGRRRPSGLKGALAGAAADPGRLAEGLKGFLDADDFMTSTYRILGEFRALLGKEGKAAARHLESLERARKRRRLWLGGATAAVFFVSIALLLLPARRVIRRVFYIEPGTQPPKAPPAAAPRLLGGGVYRSLRGLPPDAFGEVLEAVDSRTGQRVVIRRIRKELYGSGRELDRFLESARALAKLQHPNIAEVRWVFLEEGCVHLVTAPFEGVRLADRLTAKRLLGLPEALCLVREVLLAVEYAHSAGICHGSLSPACVLVAEDGLLKVQDFGIGFEAAKSAARLAWKELSESSPYMAPEQELGSVLPSSDVFSAGVILYEMATGRKPFPGPDYLSQKRSRGYPLAVSVVPTLPEELDAVLSRALDPEPSVRYRDAGALLRELEARVG